MGRLRGGGNGSTARTLRRWAPIPPFRRRPTGRLYSGGGRLEPFQTPSPYRSGQFGRQRLYRYYPAMQFESQSLNTDQGSSDLSLQHGAGYLPRYVSIPPYRSGQFGLHEVRTLVGPGGEVSLNPSIQIRAVRTEEYFLRVGFETREEPSQSLNTDQGSSDRSSRTTRPKARQRVSIPQYRSGQFGLDSELWIEMCDGRMSQSLNTDQGSSDSTPRKALQKKGLRWLFFPPPSAALFLTACGACLMVVAILQIVDGKSLRGEVQPVCQNGDLEVACFLSALEFFFSFQRGWRVSAKFTPEGFPLQRRQGAVVRIAYSSAMRPRPKVAPLPAWRISAVRRRAARSGGMVSSISRVPRRPPRVTLRCWRLL